MNIKVQIKGQYSINAMLKAGNDGSLPSVEAIQDKYLTFIAFSQLMQASVLKMMASNPDKEIKLSLTNETTTGEWYED